MALRCLFFSSKFPSLDLHIDCDLDSLFTFIHNKGGPHGQGLLVGCIGEPTTYDSAPRGQTKKKTGGRRSGSRTNEWRTGGTRMNTTTKRTTGYGCGRERRSRSPHQLSHVQTAAMGKNDNRCVAFSFVLIICVCVFAFR